jgi:hypothetical protein
LKRCFFWKSLRKFKKIIITVITEHFLSFYPSSRILSNIFLFLKFNNFLFIYYLHIQMQFYCFPVLCFILILFVCVWEMRSNFSLPKQLYRKFKNRWRSEFLLILWIERNHQKFPKEFLKKCCLGKRFSH